MSKLEEAAEKAATNEFGTAQPGGYREIWLRGAKWQLANLPRCRTCKNFGPYEEIDGRHYCLNPDIPNGYRAEEQPMVSQAFGCLLHSELQDLEEK